MRAVWYVPPLGKLSGGLANIYETAANMRAIGLEAALTGPKPDAPGYAEARRAGLPALDWGAPFAPGDIFIVPESWPNVIARGLEADIPVYVYVQSWVYMFGNLPEGVAWRQLPVRYLAVSRPVAWLLGEVLGLEVDGLLPPVVHEDFFRPAQRPSGHVRIAWMPRKNRALGEQARQVAEAKLALAPNAPRLEWLTIHNLPRAEVAERLASCHLFLSIGFPEGFGLPPAEAMASGCVPVGFTGLGGWEYMRQAGGQEPQGQAARPPCPLPEDDLPGNGFYCADGDSVSAGLALARAAVLAGENGPAWRELEAACRETAARYDRRGQCAALRFLFRRHCA